MKKISKIIKEELRNNYKKEKDKIVEKKWN
jgi:hypothetical protein